MKSSRVRNSSLLLQCAAFAAIAFQGCGPAESVYPTGEFTEEQKKGALIQDQNIEFEESQGKLQGGKPIKVKK
jgi:hypothetical protein